MPELTGPAIAPGDLNEVYSRTVIDLGTRIKDNEGNEYIFLNGVASTIKGSWVTYDEQHVTTLLAGNAKGPVAVAMGAHVADKYGWYCIFGSVLAAVAANTADNALLGYETTAGYAGDGRAGGDIMYGAISRSSTGGAVEPQTRVQIFYPFVDNEETAH